MKKIILFIILFGIGLGALGFWYWQKNPYSKEILKVEILGPSEITSFEEVEYIVIIKNNGNIRLEEPRLIFEFPEYSLLKDGSGRRQEIGADDLGDIYPGEEKRFNFKGVIVGKESETKTANVWVNYQPKGLKARYESSSSLTSVIKGVSLTFDFDIPSKIEAGKEFKFFLNYFSNVDFPIDNIGIKIEYPFDFEFIQSNPKSLAKNEWDIPLLNKAEGGRIEVLGAVGGEPKDHKIFKAQLGLWRDGEFILLKETSRGIEIAKPHLLIFQEINKDRNYIASPGELLHYEIYFKNIGDEPFVDLFLVATLEGEGFNFDTLKLPAGQFSRGNKSVVWDSREIPELRFLDQGKEGKVEFWIELKEVWDADKKGSVLKNSVLISKLRETFETKVNSKMGIFQRAFYQDEVFGNYGPIPPRVGEETTYTIIWHAKNYHNDMKNTKVKAVLPGNVRLTGKIFPEQETANFSFDSRSREIVWSVGNSEPFLAGEEKTISFQVALNPSSNQRGNAALLLYEAKISGDDQWTNKTVEFEAPALDTSLADDY